MEHLSVMKLATRSTTNAVSSPSGCGSAGVKSEWVSVGGGVSVRVPVSVRSLLSVSLSVGSCVGDAGCVGEFLDTDRVLVTMTLLENDAVIVGFVMVDSLLLDGVRRVIDADERGDKLGDLAVSDGSALNDTVRVSLVVPVTWLVKDGELLPVASRVLVHIVTESDADLLKLKLVVAVES